MTIDYQALLNAIPAIDHATYRINQQKNLQAVIQLNLDIKAQLENLNASVGNLSVNTATMSMLDAAAKEGRAYSVGTGTVKLNRGKFLKTRLYNPATNDKNLIIKFRLFTNSRKHTDEICAISLSVNPPELINPELRNPNNLKSGEAPSSAEFKFSADENLIDQSRLGAPLPLNGIARELDVIRIVKPGESIGHQIQSLDGSDAGEGLYASISYVWYEEDA